MSTINTETGEVMNTGRSPRFSLWGAFLVFSTITLISAVETKNTSGNSSSNATWAVASSAIAFSISFIVVIMHLHSMLSNFIVGTKVEGLLCTIMAAFGAVTVAVVSNATNGLAVDNSQTGNTVINANLYYFSWAGFVTSILLVVGYLRSAFGVDLAGEFKNRAARLTIWAAMLASALVVMGASANVFQKDCQPQIESDVYCRRTKFGIALGAVSVTFSLIIVGMKMVTASAPFVLESALALCLAVMNGFGVAFITSSKGPGSPIGNLYYFSWASFLCSFLLCTSCYESYKGAGAQTEEQANGTGDVHDDPMNGDVNGDKV